MIIRIYRAVQEETSALSGKTENIILSEKIYVRPQTIFQRFKRKIQKFLFYNILSFWTKETFLLLNDNHPSLKFLTNCGSLKRRGLFPFLLLAHCIIFKKLFNYSIVFM